MKAFLSPLAAFSPILFVLFGLAASLKAQSSSASAQPGTVGTPVVQIDCGAEAAGEWPAETEYVSGGTTDWTPATVDTSAVSEAPPPKVYQTDRHGNMTYTIGGLKARGAFTVRLHFSEPYWTEAGHRSQNVTINGDEALTDYDVFDAAGGKDKAVAPSFATTADGSGQIVIEFTTVKDNAIIQGIEILVGGSAAPTPDSGAKR